MCAPARPLSDTDALNTPSTSPHIYNERFPLAASFETTEVRAGTGFNGDSGWKIGDSANVDE